MINIHLSGRRLLAVAGVAMLAIAAVIAVMAMSASAAANTIGVRTVKVGVKREPIAVNAKGLALYTLSGDSAKHMLCTKANGCFSAWPPAGVANGNGLRSFGGTWHVVAAGRP